MAEFFTGKALDEKLTDIIWKANKELIILSPFIRLDEYCKKIFSKLKKSPELEIILVFGKNEGETQRSLNQDDLSLLSLLLLEIIQSCIFPIPSNIVLKTEKEYKLTLVHIFLDLYEFASALLLCKPLVL